MCFSNTLQCLHKVFFLTAIRFKLSSHPNHPTNLCSSKSPHLSSPQELREMVKLPDTRPEMLTADFEGVAEALKGETIISSPLIFFFLHCTKMFSTLLSLSKTLPATPLGNNLTDALTNGTTDNTTHVHFRRTFISWLWNVLRSRKWRFFLIRCVFAVLSFVLSVKKKDLAALVTCLWLTYAEKGVSWQEVYKCRAHNVNQTPKSFSSQILVKSAVFIFCSHSLVTG